MGFRLFADFFACNFSFRPRNYLPLFRMQEYDYKI